MYFPEIGRNHRLRLILPKISESLMHRFGGMFKETQLRFQSIEVFVQDGLDDLWRNRLLPDFVSFFEGEDEILSRAYALDLSPLTALVSPLYNESLQVAARSCWKSVVPSLPIKHANENFSCFLGSLAPLNWISLEHDSPKN